MQAPQSLTASSQPSALLCKSQGRRSLSMACRIAASSDYIPYWKFLHGRELICSVSSEGSLCVFVCMHIYVCNLFSQTGSRKGTSIKFSDTLDKLRYFLSACLIWGSREIYQNINQGSQHRGTWRKIKKFCGHMSRRFFFCVLPRASGAAYSSGWSRVGKDKLGEPGHTRGSRSAGPRGCGSRRPWFSSTSLSSLFCDKRQLFLPCTLVHRM